MQLLDQYGEIKTSLYFLHVRRNQNLPHDFYVTRYYEGSRQRTVVVMMKPRSWKQINGDTVQTSLEQATKQFPSPAMVQINGRPIVIIDYNVWKSRVLRKQQSEDYYRNIAVLFGDRRVAIKLKGSPAHPLAQ